MHKTGTISIFVKLIEKVYKNEVVEQSSTHIFCILVLVYIYTFSRRANRTGAMKHMTLASIWFQLV